MSKPVRLPSGRWRIRFFDTDGKRQSETYETEVQARAALRRRQVEVDDVRAGIARPKSNKRLRDVVTEWLESRPQRRAADNKSHLDNHILPFLGDKTLAQIMPDLIERFIRHLEGKTTARKGEKNADKRRLSPATINNALITLRKLMNDNGHPIRVRYRVPTAGYQWIRDAAEVTRFLDGCGSGWFRIAAELGVYAGLRKGEIAGLTRDAIDFDRLLIRVDRSYEGPTKTKHMRWVPLAPSLAKTLRAWMVSHHGPKLIMLTTETADGETKLSPMTPDTELAKRTRRACKRAGVEPVNFHQLRHTAASHLAQRVPLPIVGAVLGHADPKTTARYAHLDTESVARSEKLHLNFEAPSGKVVKLPTRVAT